MKNVVRFLDATTGTGTVFEQCISAAARHEIAQNRLPHLEACRTHSCQETAGASFKASLHYYYIYILTAIGLSPGGSGYFTCKQNMKLVTNKFKSGGLHEKHVVATWNVGNRLSICL